MSQKTLNKQNLNKLTLHKKTLFIDTHDYQAFGVGVYGTNNIASSKDVHKETNKIQNNETNKVLEINNPQANNIVTNNIITNNIRNHSIENYTNNNIDNDFQKNNPIEKTEKIKAKIKEKPATYVDDENDYKYIVGSDGSKNLIPSFHALHPACDIDEIIIIKGPGSLTGLRIGSSAALGIALGIQTRLNKEIAIKSLTIWDILFQEYKNLTVFFYTGTKKWIVKTQENEIITENIADINFSNWMCNNIEKIQKLQVRNEFTAHNNIPYPALITLMPKYAHLAKDNVDLLYPVNLF